MKTNPPEKKLNSYQIDDIYQEEYQEFMMPSGKLRILLYCGFFLLILLISCAFLVQIPFYLTIQGTLEELQDNGDETSRMIIAAQAGIFPRERLITLTRADTEHSFQVSLIHLPSPGSGQAEYWEMQAETVDVSGLKPGKHTLKLKMLIKRSSFIDYLIH